MTHGITRRKLIGLIGAAALLLTGRRFEWPGAIPLKRLLTQATADAAVPRCLVRPEQTEGPYFVDERLNRSDIRSDPSDGSVKEGLPLQLAFRISEIRGRDCAPLVGAMVDVWHCDAKGVYSDVRDRSFFNTRGKKFLRGYQMTDAGGMARFVTIFPGWYPGRSVHIHFKIRMNPDSPRGRAFTSQIYFDDALTDRILAHPPYLPEGKGRIRNRLDFIFQEGGSELILPLTQEAEGYAGTFEIGLVTG